MKKTASRWVITFPVNNGFKSVDYYDPNDISKLTKVEWAYLMVTMHAHISPVISGNTANLVVFQELNNCARWN